MTSVDMNGDREPRHFSRRALAFLLDIVLAQLVVTLLFSAVDAATGTSLGDAPSVSASECSPAPAGHPQVVRVEGIWPLPAGSRRENTICHYGTGQDQSWTFTTHVVWKEGTTNYSKKVSFDIDRDGKEVATAYAPNFGPFVIVALFIVLAAKGWRSPGKAAMGLRIRTAAGATPGWGHAVRREIFKLLPLVAFGLFANWMAVAPPAFLTDSEAALVAMRDGGFMTASGMLLLIGWCGGTVLWWLGPFALWRGRTWYDALAGTKLVRSDLPVASGPRRP